MHNDNITMIWPTNMTVIIQMSPILVLLILLFCLRLSPVKSAFVATLWAVLVMVLGGVATPNVALFASAIVDASLLLLSVAFVIVPGFLFAALLKNDGFDETVKLWIAEANLSEAQLLAFVLYGLAPTLEGITGFGISLIITTPIFLSLFERSQALRMSVLTMGVMPWGIMGLPTIIGATIANIDPSTLGWQSSITSFLVFLCFGIIALIVCKSSALSGYALVSAVAFIFCCTMGFINKAFGPHLSCVGSGVIVSILLLCYFRHKGNSIKFPPYAYLFITLALLLMAMNSISSYLNFIDYFAFHGVRVSWNPLLSPGIALFAVCIFFIPKANIKATYIQVANRTKRPLMMIGSLVVFSQIIVKGGFFVDIENYLADTNALVLPWIVSICGGLSGYITGSTVGGNALLMTSIRRIGGSDSRELWLAAIQNSSSGVGALSSLSVIAIISGLAAAREFEERNLLIHGLVLLVFGVMLIGLTGSIVINIPLLQ